MTTPLRSTQPVSTARSRAGLFALALVALPLVHCSAAPGDGAADDEGATDSNASAATSIRPAKANGSCVDVSGASTANGARLLVWGCHGGANQQWTSTGGTLRVYGTKCLDVVDGKDVNGNAVQIWDCSAGNGNQQWTREGSHYRWSGHTKCLDLSGGNTANGTPVQIWDCANGNTNQDWSGASGGTTPPTSPTTTPTTTPTTPPTTPPPPSSGGIASILSESTFNAMFPNRLSVYSYQGLIDAAKAYPAFATTGTDEQRRREVAAFLANVTHESGHLQYVEEIAKAAYCQSSSSCPCQSGQWYYGRGALQLSWNYNYCSAGPAFGVDLRANPGLVATTPRLAWGTGLWFWMTSSGAGSQTPHDGIRNSGFGETIRSINGSLECNRGGGGSVATRVGYYLDYAARLGVSPGGNTGC